MDYVDAMRAFLQVSRLGTMSAAARELEVSVAALSKRVAHLESRLGARLFNRTTRSMALTDPGRAYLERCRRILADIEEAEAAVTGLHGRPRGELRVSASVSFGRKHVAPLLCGFLARYPELRVYLQLTDQIVDLVDEGLDLAIRIGTLEDTSLMARRLARNRRIICATPDYLERHGTPQVPEDLGAHNCLVLNYPGSPHTEWPFRYPDGQRSLRVGGNFESNNAEAITRALLSGLGLAMQSTWNVGAELMSGALVPVLGPFMVPDVSVHAVYPPTRQASAKVRAFIDMLVEAIGPEPYWDRGLESLFASPGP